MTLIPGLEDEALGRIVEIARRRLEALLDRIHVIRQQSGHREDVAGVLLLLDELEELVAECISRNELSHRKILRLNTEKKADAARKNQQRELSEIRLRVRVAEKQADRPLQHLTSPPLRNVEPLISAFVRMARDLTHSEATELVFTAGSSPTYGVVPDAIKGLRASLNTNVRGDIGEAEGAQLTAVRPKLAMIEYPAREDAETLNHSLIAHEVAHVVLEGEGIEGVPRDEIFFGTCKKEPQPSLKAFQSNLGSETEANVFKRWITELGADHIAIRTVGPAFYFAFVEHVIASTEFTTESTAPKFGEHPPILLRLKWLQSEVEDFLDQLKPEVAARVRPQVDRWSDVVDGCRVFIAKRDQEIIQTVEGFLEAALKATRAFVSDKMTEALYKPEQFNKDAPEVWRKFASGIAPSEQLNPLSEHDDNEPWSNPVDWRSILNAAHIWWLEKSPDPGETEQQIREDSNRMVRGSIELSELHRKLRGLRSAYEQIGDLA